MGIRKPSNLALQSDRVLALLAARPLSATVRREALKMGHGQHESEAEALMRAASANDAGFVR